LFGICWDFGHAHLARQDQVSSLKTIGTKLYALHVHDKRGLADEHLLPYFGKIAWNPVMRTLKDVHYKGDFTFAVHHFTDGLPNAYLYRKAIDFAYVLCLCNGK